MQWLNKVWYQKNSLAWLLAPLGYGYCFIMWLRRLCFKWGLRRTHHFKVPVIVVGNLTVGGTGKTPLVAAIALALKQQGLKPGLVSRGYGGKARKWPQAVTVDSDPRQVGDEAVLLAQKTGCPMRVGPDRVAAVTALLADHACDVVISDDGLQHLALGRDLEIVVVDGQRGFGNGFCLPAGPLRESLKRLSSVDCIVINGQPDTPQRVMKSTLPSPCFEMQFKATGIYNVLDPSQALDINALANKPIHAVVGIGHPERFFASLKALGFSSIIPHVYPDHYCYQKQDFDFAVSDVVIMTDKDAVKCRSLVGHNGWSLAITVDIESQFWNVFKQFD